MDRRIVSRIEERLAKERAGVIIQEILSGRIESTGPLLRDAEAHSIGVQRRPA
jgi:hypothetical protein